MDKILELLNRQSQDSKEEFARLDQAAEAIAQAAEAAAQVSEAAAQAAEHIAQNNKEMWLAVIEFLKGALGHHSAADLKVLNKADDSQKSKYQYFEEELDVVFLALDRSNRSCKFVKVSEAEWLDADDMDAAPSFYSGQIYHGQIWDPEFEAGSNIYSQSLDSQEPLHVWAKVKRTVSTNSLFYVIGSHK